MKRILYSCFIFLLLSKTISGQEILDASIVGIISEGKTVSASYTLLNESVAAIVNFQWMRIDLAGVDYFDPDTVPLVTTQNYTIVPADIGYRLVVRADLEDGAVYDTAFSALTAVVVANSAPVATNATISGGLNVGDFLYTDYDYSDVDGDLEGTSLFQWRVGPTTTFGDASDIGGATSKTYQILPAQEGMYFFFGVQPAAATGATPGVYAWSGSHGPVTTNSVPVASGVTISGGLDAGDILSASYNYYDTDNDLEGASLFQWRVGPTTTFGDASDIGGATSKTYQILPAQEGMYFFFGVEPAAATGATPGGYAWSSSHGPVTANSVPVASGVAVTGGLDAGDILSASYNYYDADNDIEGTSLFQWRVGPTTTFGDASDIGGATSKTYQILPAQEGMYFFFGVEPAAASGASPGGYAWSSSHGPVTINSVPTTSGRIISGGYFVDGVLIGNYDYDDVDNDLEGNSQFRWAVGNTTVQAAASVIALETNAAYLVRSSDQGKYLFFGVQPIAKTGDTDGVEEWTGSHGPINSQPVASAVTIDNINPLVNDDLTGLYVFDDVDPGEDEGTSTYRWLRDGIEIPGANSDNYTVTFDDIGSTLIFEVIPLSDGGYPLEGDPVQSSATTEVPPPGLPVALNICISGVRETGNELTGYYTYNYGKDEGATTFQWYRESTPIPLATSKTYTLTDLDKLSSIRFAVKPVSGGKHPVTGLEAFSNSLVSFNIPNDNISKADPPVNLIASPAGGVFSGEGVSVNIFDPSAVNTDNSPFIIDYLLSIPYSGHTCVQEVYDTITVKPIDTYFTSLKDVYCYDNGNDTVIVRNLPVDASEPTFTFTNPAAIVTILNDTSIIFNPAILGPGNYADSIYFSYKRDSSLIVIERGFVVDSVGTNLLFQNLDDQYCTDAAARFITVDNVYPAGGGGFWTGDMLTNKSATSSVLNPGLVSAGAAYLIEYQYTSPNGCKSAIITRSVTINTLPVPGFLIDPTYNLVGDPDILVPVQTGGIFTGPGIVGNEFYPSIAGGGSHVIRYSITDSDGCFNTTTNTTLVRKALGTIESLPGIICYIDSTYNISMSGLPLGVTITGFSNVKGGLVSTGSTTADYYIPDVGSAYDTVSFAYIWDGVDYDISKIVYVDSIGKIVIIGLNDAYCEYEGDINMRITVENSSGSGNFSFSGPDSSFVNYGQIADLYPYKTPTSAIPYSVSYKHVSAVQSSGCAKTVTQDVYVYAKPVIDIITDRATANLEENPFVLEGNPSNGIFTGSGVYKDGAVYKFNPILAGPGVAPILFSYVDNNTCFASQSKDILVVQAKGTIEGISPNNQYCYDSSTDTIFYVNANPGWTGISFQGSGITSINNTSAIFDPASAGKGDHQILYSYYDSVLTRFDLPATLKVDSLGSVEISNLDPFSEFCNNLEPFELFTSKIGGVFTGPMDDSFLDPSMGLGDTEVTYKYTNIESGCFTSVTVPIKINPAPNVDFDIEDVCIEYPTDTTRFINSSTSGDQVATWAWRFGDPGSYNESATESPGHLYRTHGPRIVKLTATTVNACISSIEKNIDLGIKPNADFAWTGDCYIVADSLLLFDKSISAAPIVGYEWNFFDGNATVTGETVKYLKSDTGEINVQHIVYTSYEACHDTISKLVFIRPTFYLQEDDYLEEFEVNEGGWIAGLGESNNMWSFGTPDRATIDNASSGVNAWYTDYDINNQVVADYSVESPCFDFSAIERPFVSLDVWKRFDRNRDGVALQYKIGNESNWKLIGSYEDGINWYNSVAITGTPGGQSIGWTSAGGQDTSWINVRNKLDLLSGKKNVKFRLIYGSDGTSNENEGFAFDNFMISSRNRNVILEHFTNYNDVKNKDANSLLKEVVDNTEQDVISIQYHTNIGGSDEFYYDNEADVGARTLFYGLSGTPFSFVDGGINSLFAYEYNYVLNNKIDSIDLYQRSMIKPYFEIDLTSQVTGGVLNVQCEIAALEDINAQNLTLYLLVIESEVNLAAPNGETVFYNVFKKMLPDAGGTDLKKNWVKNESEIHDGFSWVIENVYSTGDIEIVAFIQNNLTKEIYQASSTFEIGVVTSISLPGAGSYDSEFAIYPNPAYDFIVVDFKEEIFSEALLNIYDYAGILVYSSKIGAGTSQFRINNPGFPDGMYIIRVVRDGRALGSKKLIISKR